MDALENARVNVQLLCNVRSDSEYLSLSLLLEFCGGVSTV